MRYMGGILIFENALIAELRPLTVPACRPPTAFLPEANKKGAESHFTARPCTITRVVIASQSAGANLHNRH